MKYWSVLLLLFFTLQLGLALFAEYQGNYIKACYEMIWALLFAFLMYEDRQDVE